MAYLVLARKYRPRSFAEMVGQEHVVQALRHALEQQRLHHAWLFTGTRGVGKTTVSRILAKSLNCTGTDGAGGITANPCGQCPACQAIDGGRFADYIELDAASNRGVEEVQTLLEQAVYKPVQGRFKVFMIDEVHMLTTTAFNAMLKTLEEPPPYLKFVLATTDPQKVPVTVLSRCLQFNLRPMRARTVAEHLARVLAAENVPAEPAALALLGQAARGSMRDALSLTDQAIAFGAGRVAEADVRHMLGTASTDSVAHILAAWAAADATALFQQAEAVRDQGSAPAAVLDALARALQRIAAWQTVPDLAAQAQHSAEPEVAQLLPIAAQLAPDTTQFLYNLCLHGRSELAQAPDEYDALLMLMLRPLAFGAIEAPKGQAAQVTAPHAATSANAQPTVANFAQNIASSSHAATFDAAPPASAPSPQTPPNAPTPFEAEGFKSRFEARSAPPEPVEPAAPASAATTAHATPNVSVAASTAPTSIAPTTVSSAPPVPDHIPPTCANDPATSANIAQTPPNAPASFEAEGFKSRFEARSAPPEPVEPVVEPAAPSATSAPPTSPADSEGEILETSGDFWCALVQALLDGDRVRHLARELAVRSQLVRRTASGAWHLHAEPASANHPQARARLLEAIQGLWAQSESDPQIAKLFASEANLAASQPNFAQIPQSLHIRQAPTTDTVAQRQERAHAAQTAYLEAIVAANPTVQALTQQWGAHIVPGTIAAA